MARRILAGMQYSTQKFDNPAAIPLDGSLPFFEHDWRMPPAVFRLAPCDFERRESLTRSMLQIRAFEHQPLQDRDPSPDARRVSHGSPFLLARQHGSIGGGERLQPKQLSERGRLKRRNDRS